MWYLGYLLLPTPKQIIIFCLTYIRKASAVVGYLDQIHKMKKRGSVPNTLVMEHLINQVFWISYYWTVKCCILFSNKIYTVVLAIMRDMFYSFNELLIYLHCLTKLFSVYFSLLDDYLSVSIFVSVLFASPTFLPLVQGE